MLFAAGNDGADMATAAGGFPMYPASFAGDPGLECVVAVAAVSQDRTLAWFSNYGTKVTISAPGAALAYHLLHRHMCTVCGGEVSICDME